MAENGTLTRKRNAATLESWAYAYDEFGNLLAASGTDKQIAYEVDGLRRRVGKYVNGTFAEGYLWRNELQLIADVDANGQLRNRFVYASGGRMPDYFERDGEIYRLITDHLGSVRLVVNATTGDVEQRMDYDEFGQVLFDSNPGFQPFGFAGGLYDGDTVSSASGHGIMTRIRGVGRRRIPYCLRVGIRTCTGMC